MRLTTGRFVSCSTAMAMATGLLSGCSATDSLMPPVTVPAEEAATAAVGRPTTYPPPGGGESGTGRLMITAHQQEFLDALVAGGLHPSSELLALRIGSYVCQARAARQSPQAVWDFVEPLVSSDVRDTQVTAPSDAEVGAATYNYIRIATEELC